ncbi:MAG: hypothetical protein ACPLSP_04630 [Fervidicoccus fontis]
MSEVLIFAMGCTGAIAPEIVRLYKIRTKPLPHFPKSYFLISILFAFLGGIVAIILPATTLWGAFYVGVSLPTLISGIGGKNPTSTPILSRTVTQKATVQEFLGALFF